MSRASSQQRFYDQPEPTIPDSPTSDWKQQRSLSRNDSQKSLTDYQQQQNRQPDPIITTRIEESIVEPNFNERKPSVTFRNDEYEQQPQNLQPMVEQRGYDPGPQQYQEPVYDQRSYQQQPISQPEYAYDTQQYSNYEQVQPVTMAPTYIQSPATTASYETQPEPYRNQYEQQQSYRSDSRRQSPEQEFQSQPYIQPETPKRATPPKRESPPREQFSSPEDSTKSLQQRQQSRDQLYAREKTESPENALRSSQVQQRQQSRESLQEAPPQKSPSPTASTKGPAKPMAPPSPTRNKGKPPTKGGVEQKDSRNTVGEAARIGRKSTDVQKQPAKAVTSVRGKK